MLAALLYLPNNFYLTKDLCRYMRPLLTEANNPGPLHPQCRRDGRHGGLRLPRARQRYRQPRLDISRRDIRGSRPRAGLGLMAERIDDR